MKKLGVIILALLLYFSLVSCISLQVVSKGYTEENTVIDKRDIFFLESTMITSFNFRDEEEIALIMDKKLVFTLTSNQIGLTKEKESAHYIILPELIINNYEEKYDFKNYYYFSIKVLSLERILCHFTYEYNGTSSIFDGRVQNIMIKKFMDDLFKIMND